MEIQFLSDLHLECSPFDVEKNGDMLVLAGDIFCHSSITRFENFMEKTMDLGFDAVLFVMGNHEGYGWSIPEAKELLREMEDKYEHFWFLDRAGIVIDGQRFIGASLWSSPTQNASIQARLYINDYRAIRGWTIEDHIYAHFADLDYLSTVMCLDDVVITHFPPTYNGVDKVRFDGDVLTTWFVNDLNDLIIRRKPKLWISGHTHHCWEEAVGVTQDVGNCRGYTWINRSTGMMVGEVQTFNPTRAITIETTNHSSIGAAS